MQSGQSKGHEEVGTARGRGSAGSAGKGYYRCDRCQALSLLPSYQLSALHHRQPTSRRRCCCICWLKIFGSRCSSQAMVTLLRYPANTELAKLLINLIYFNVIMYIISSIKSCLKEKIKKKTNMQYNLILGINKNLIFRLHNYIQ